MVEPTKKAIAVFYSSAPNYDGGHLSRINGEGEYGAQGQYRFPVYVLTAEQLAGVRKKARDDALEEVAVVCDELTNFWDECGNIERARTYTAFAKSIRSGWNDTALKDQPSGEA